MFYWFLKIKSVFPLPDKGLNNFEECVFRNISNYLAVPMKLDT